jgi:DNA-directed RNA polymerase specialized sigma24 family protein
MNIKLHYEGLTAQDAPAWAETLRALTNKHLTPLLAKHGVANGVLHVTLQKLKRGNKTYGVRLHMHLPGRKIVIAQGEGTTASGASEAAVNHLFREAKKHFEHLRGQRQYMRKARSERLQALKDKIAALPAPVVSQARQGVEGLLQRLESVARRELAYLRAVGDLPANYPSVRDVVDEAAVATQAAWRPASDSETAYRRLLKSLFQVIDREVAASRRYLEAVSLDAPMPADPRDAAESAVEEEIYEYYQPDDTLSLADVLPAPADEEESEASPALERLSAQALVVDVLKDLPVAWRRALLLVEIEALALESVAEVLDTHVQTVEGWIEQARRFVETRLQDAGLAPSTHAGRMRLGLWLRRVG